MPCKPQKARKLLAGGKAKVVSRTPFIIKLNYGSTGYKQPLTGGMDTGSKTVGCAVIGLGDYCFAPHLAYVALSRVRTTEGIHLVRPLKQADIKIDYSVNRFCKSNNLL